MPLPHAGLPQAVCVDHIAHFVPNMGAASADLQSLGFTLTPLSAQSHHVEPDATPVPAGTSNRCVMLRNGYLEFLTPTHDTPNAQQLRVAMDRYTGVHLIAFGSTAPAADYARLEAEGFSPLPPIALQRQVGTEGGEATARFTVVRVAPGAMAEGRIQYCQHHTLQVVWQTRWIDHANHAVGLAGILVCVADPAQTARRYARFTGLPVHQSGRNWRLDTARGYVLFADKATLQQLPGVQIPALPWIAGCVLDSDDLSATARLAGGNAFGERLCLPLPETLGGVLLFQAAGSAPLQLADT